MNGVLKVCAVSGSRADYGLLVPVLRLMRDDPRFGLQLVLTGQHLVAGGTAAKVRDDGFVVAAEVDMGLERDDPTSIIASAGRGLQGLAPVLARLAPDLMFLLGDRYEILCAAAGATIAHVPVAHVAGGDVTEGSFDDVFRHALTKMAHLHFVTHADAARRVRQLGEESERIHVVGSPGLDLIRTTRLLSRESFFASIGLAPRRINLVIALHPVTLATDTLAQLDELLAALAALGNGTTLLFTGSNADPEGQTIDARMQAFAVNHPSARFIASLGSEKYFAALAHMDALVGNSSSGLYEAPSFGIPAVNIGDRQHGRLKAASVIDCAAERAAIGAAITHALVRGRVVAENPYGDGHAAEKIIAVLSAIHDPRALLRKRFVDLAA